MEKAQSRLPITAGRVRDFACPPGKVQAFLWDASAPGLAVRATPSGGKAFIFQAKLNGAALRVTIGDCRTWAIDAARGEARRLYALVDRGIDPRQEKAERIAADEAKRGEARRAGVTVGEAWADYIEARSHKWGDRHRRDHERAMSPGGVQFARGKRITGTDRTAPGMLYPLAALRLAELDRGTAAQWIQQANLRGKTEAAKHFRLLRAFVQWCAQSEKFAAVTKPEICSGRAVRDHVKRVTAKDDCLQREQLALWFEHVRKLPNPVHSAYLQSMLLTGARPGELVGIRWEDVDFQWKALTIRDKVEGERTIPLTPYVATLLAALPRRNEWVFSSPTAADGRLVEPRYAHAKALTAAGLPALTLHGLRRSFGTLAEWVECPAGISAQIMGHKPSAIAEKHYRRRPLDLLRMWHTKIEAWILEQAGIEQPKEGEQGLRVVAAH